MSRVSRSTLDSQMSSLTQENTLLGHVIDTLKGNVQSEHEAHAHTKGRLSDAERMNASLTREFQVCGCVCGCLCMFVCVCVCLYTHIVFPHARDAARDCVAGRA
jgi:hypothetical protein